MSTARKRYEKQLGMDLGTAQHRLRKKVMFSLVEASYGTKCFRCGQGLTADDFTLDHRTAWRNSSNASDKFWDLGNIEWSHSVCNTQASRSHNGLLEFCKNGHKLSGRNVRKNRNFVSRRECRACNLERWHKSNRARDRRIRRLGKQGLSCREIAKRVDVSHVTVWKILKN